MLIIIIIKNT